MLLANASARLLRAVPVSSNAVDVSIFWAGEEAQRQAAMQRAQGQRVQLRFSLRDAELYSSWLQ